MKILFRYYVINKNAVPKNGPIILASNHVSFIDSPMAIVACPRQIFYIGKKEYFQTDTLKHRIVNWLFRKMGVIPVDREGGKKAESALLEAENVLKRGDVFCIYPEGTRSPDAKLYKGHTGVARIALASRADILPVAMLDTWVANPIGEGIKMKKCGAKFGEVISIKEYLDKEVTKELLREITDRIMLELSKLSNQEYVPNVYGKEVRDKMKNLKVYGEK